MELVERKIDSLRRTKKPLPVKPLSSEGLHTLRAYIDERQKQDQLTQQSHYYQGCATTGDPTLEKLCDQLCATYGLAELKECLEGTGLTPELLRDNLRLMDTPASGKSDSNPGPRE